MSENRHLWLLFVLMSAALAGCLGNGEIKSETLEVEYSGSENGEHEDRGDCDGDARLSPSGKVEDGELRIVIRDGANNVVHDQTYRGDIDDGNSTRVNGSSGTWTLRAERAGDDLVGDQFQGNYRFTLGC